MSTRASGLLAAAVLVLPLPAYADCSERIAAVERHPAVAGADASGGNAEKPLGGGTEKSTAETRPAENAEGVREDGGKSVYPDGGPATPTESWFTGEDDAAAAPTHLAAARKARGEGNEEACIDAVEQAETALGSHAG